MPLGTVEWRTFVGLPSSLTLAKAKAKRGFKLVGKLTVQGLNPKNIRLWVYAGKKARPAPTATAAGTGKRSGRSGKLPATGKYSILRASVKFTTFFQTRFENYITELHRPIAARGSPVPCKGEDLAAMTSNQVKATKPKKRR